MKFLIVVVFISLNSLLFAQGKIKGVVTDIKNQPMAFANVQLLNENKTTFVSYCITDTAGRFVINAKQDGHYYLKVTFLGYQKVFEHVSVDKTSKPHLHITLKVSTENLKEVVVEGDIPDVILKKDTIVYNISEYLSGTEENLSDVIKKLPGLDIDENGKISAKGKKIDKLLIDGEEFFDNQHQLVTENISPEMVKNIELLENYQSFSSVASDERTGLTALNIKMKEAYTRRTTGNIEAGYGYKDRWELKANLFNLHSKFKIGVVSNSNNTGQKAISIEDYLSFQGGIQKYMKNANGIGAQIIDEKDLPDFLLAKDKVTNYTSNTFALNFIYKPSEKLKINGFGILNLADIKKHEVASQLYFADVANISSIDSTRNTASLFFNSNVLEATYKQSENSVFNYTLSFSPLSDNNSNNIISSTKDTSRHINQIFDNKSFVLGQQFSYIQKLSLKTSLTINAFYELAEYNNVLNISSDNILFNIGGNHIEQDKIRNRKSYGFNIKTRIKLKNSSLNVFIANNTINKTFESKVENIDMQADYYNNISLNHNDNFAGFSFMWKLNKRFSVDLGSKFHYYLLKNGNLNTDLFVPEPKMGLTINFELNKYISLSYNYSNKFSPIEKIIPNRIIKDFRTIELNQDIRFDNPIPLNQYQINYFSYNINTGSMLVLNASYLISSNAIAVNAENEGNISLIKYKLSPIDNFASAFFLFDQDFEKRNFSLRFFTIYTYIDKLFYIGDYLENRNINNIIKSSLKLSTNFKSSVINFSIGINYLFNQTEYKASTLTTKLSTFEPFVSYNGKINENINWYLDFSYLNYKTNNIKRDLYKLSPKIKYHKNKWNYTVYAYNILNINNSELIEISNYPDYYQTKIYSVLAGYALFSIAYKF